MSMDAKNLEDSMTSISIQLSCGEKLECRFQQLKHIQPLLDDCTFSPSRKFPSRKFGSLHGWISDRVHIASLEIFI
jgi:hypothetical protein